MCLWRSRFWSRLLGYDSDEPLKRGARWPGTFSSPESAVVLEAEDLFRSGTNRCVQAMVSMQEAKKAETVN